ncbi:MAG: tripartite tricarboxylate transporter substrate binding protein [Betaproteobacteria bacterium]|nr:tripartite tricarboxylate transporter substrate binding protein [Betaproteobacteria bacterium]
MIRISTCAGFFALLIACSLAPAQQPAPAKSAPAEGYPAKPIRFVAPFPPGGGLDLMARVIAQWLSDAWGRQVVVDNRPGAGGSIGAAIAAKAAPDGYTLLIVSSAHTVNATLYRNLPYDTLKDLDAVVLVTAVPHLLVVHPSFPASTVKQLIAIAKSRPGQVAYASGGLGSSTHLAGELFRSMAKIKLLHVPYKGTGPSLVDVLSGQVPVTFGTVPSVIQQVKAGKLRALGLTGAKRARLVPDVPTIAEAGVPGYEAATWHGVLVPAGTPAAIVAKLNGEIMRMLNDSGIRARITRDGLEPLGSTPEQFDAYLRAEVRKWAQVIRTAGIRVE